MVSERRAFGDRLKRQRERVGVSLESLARTTKVSASLYASLERGDCSRWPEGIYGRAYIKAYAEAIGLDGPAVVKEFSSLFGGMTLPDESAAADAATAACTLRLAMAAEPVVRPEQVARRAALAAADLAVGSLIAAAVHAGLSAGLWPTVASVLSYFVAGRIISDEPLLYWFYLRLRSTTRSAPEPGSEDVPVADAARTTA